MTNDELQNLRRDHTLATHGAVPPPWNCDHCALFTEIKKLRKVLEWYAGDVYDAIGSDNQHVEYDRGERARRALGIEED